MPDEKKPATPATETESKNAPYTQLLLKEMQKGTDKMSIISKLTAEGMPMAEASTFVEEFYPQFMKIAQEEKFEHSSIPLAIVGGVLAAVLGGAVWGALVIYTNTEFGILAWGIGVMCGYAVVLASRGKKGFILQIIAVVTSALGILIGKYVSFYSAVNVSLKEQGQEAMSVLDTQLIEAFVREMPNMMGFYDLMWIGFAVYSAWFVPKGTGIKA